MIDTHQTIKNLEKAGFSATQAETLTNVLKDTQAQSLSDLVTKLDLHRELEPIRADLRVLKWMIGVNVTVTGTILALILKMFL